MARGKESFIGFVTGALVSGVTVATVIGTSSTEPGRINACDVAADQKQATCPAGTVFIYKNSIRFGDRTAPRVNHGDATLKSGDILISVLGPKREATVYQSNLPKPSPSPSPSKTNG